MIEYGRAVFTRHISALPVLTVFLIVLWAIEIVLILVPGGWLHHAAAWGLGLYLILALPKSSLAPRLIAFGLFGLSAVSMALSGNWASLERGLDSALIFTALLPTLQLARATARINPAVRRTESRLAALPDRQRDVGILLGAHLFGAVLNTGGFAMMAATIREDAAPETRLAHALSALRGLNMAVLWSPFFVGAAVAEHYVPDVKLWQVTPFGLGLAALALAVSIFGFSRGGRGNPTDILVSLRPIVWLLVLTGGLVGVMSAGFGMATLDAVSLLLPVLCALQWAAEPDAVAPIWRETTAAMRRMPDDLLLVASAFTLGQALEANPEQVQVLTAFLGSGASSIMLLATLIGSTIVLGIVGIHPIVPVTLLLIAFGGLPPILDHRIVMLAILCSWCLGTMNSISSLTVVVASSMFRVPRMRLIFGPNLLFVAVYGTVAVSLLTLVNHWLLAK